MTKAVMVGQHSTNKNDLWFTPAEFIEAARNTLGTIDLDPASCLQANNTVKANRYYTEQTNGLDKPWFTK
ncbi:DNA N-6-adenine-methyltransferase [Vibrio agarivorans]|uniref:DNA N-6-adenine-methyltransferase n=1 Tax=Vibrio agarivorans TaxID=153622 RepID=UPI0025B359FF|nr:DNA N-6-adenine-methyltransferase [Vibrio agarivorans]MDN3659942.1 DNA N-6-adenine-methyltransferase [Vibrio agarivorans]